MDNYLIKVSGDLLDRSEVIEWLARVSVFGNLTVCCGGGSQINDLFRIRGFPIVFGPLGRETRTEEEKRVAIAALQENKVSLERLLYEKGIPCKVIIPVVRIGDVDCPINGDQLALSAYLGFDKIYILTLRERLAKKLGEFKIYPKIIIVGF